MKAERMTGNNFLSIIPYGAENAITMKMLATITNQTERKARQTVYELRCAGALICSGTDTSGNYGYYQPRTTAEIKRYIAFQESRIKSAARAVRSARQYLRKKEGCSNE